MLSDRFNHAKNVNTIPNREGQNQLWLPGNTTMVPLMTSLFCTNYI